MGAHHASGAWSFGAQSPTQHAGSTSRRWDRQLAWVDALLSLLRPFWLRPLLCMLAALATVLWPSLSVAQTSVSGAINANTRWTLSGSPYLVADNLYVNGGATLTIDPGVVVYMASATRLQVVSGAVVAVGTAAQPIVFQSDKVRQGQAPAAGDWGPWLFTSGTLSASRLEHVRLLHGKGMAIEASSPVLNHVEWQMHQGAALTVDLQSSPSGVGLKASGCDLNGIAVPAGDLTGSVKWSLRGIPYVVSSGRVSVGASPALTSVSPASVERGQTVTLTVNGARLSGMTSPSFDRAGLPLTPFSGGSASQVYLQLQVAADAPLGQAALRMQVDAGELLLPNAITVTPPLPAITALVPTSVLAGAGLSTLTVQGRNFTSASEVLVNGAALPTTWVSAAELRASLPNQTATGTLQIQVRTPDVTPGQYLSSALASLSVQAPVPPSLTVEPTPIALPPDGRPRELTLRLSKADYRDNTIALSLSDTSKASVSPASVTIPAGQTSAKFTVTPGTTAATLSLVADSATLARVSVPVFLTADFRGANTSYAQPVGVVVTVAPGQVTRSVQVGNSLVGVSVGAVLTSAQPQAWPVGSKQVLTVAGRGIASGATVSLEPATGLSLGAVSVAADGSSLQVEIDAAANAPVGVRRVVVKDATGKLLTFADASKAAVQIVAGLPVIDSIEPATVVRGGAINLVVRGRNLQQGRVQILPAEGLAVDAQPDISADGTTLTARVDIAATAATGSRVVQVLTPAGVTTAQALAGNTLTVGQTSRPTVTPVTSAVVGVVVGQASRTPDPQVRQLGAGLVGVMSGTGVSSVTPRTGVIGNDVVVQVAGSGLNAVNAVSFVPADGLTVLSGPTPSADGKQLSFTVRVDAAAALGLRRLMLKNATGLPVTFSRPEDGAFLVSAPIPELVSVSPAIVVSGQSAVRMTVRGRNLTNTSAVRVVPAEGMTVSGPFEVSADGTTLGFTMSASAGAVSGPRALVVTSPAGESTTTLLAGNMVRVAAQLGNTYEAITAPMVGVVVGSANVRRDPVDGTLMSRVVGVQLGAAQPAADPLFRGAFSLPVGVSRGPVAQSISPRGFLQGSNGTVTVQGKSLDSVTSVSIKPDTGILLGTPTVSADLGSLSVSISVAPDAPLVSRELKLITANGPIVFADAGTSRTIGIGKLPTLTSISPILIEQGKGVTMVLRGKDLAGVVGVTFAPADGLNASPAMSWATDALGELLTITVSAESAASLGERALILQVPGGQTTSTLSPANTLKVIAPQ